MLLHSHALRSWSRSHTPLGLAASRQCLANHLGLSPSRRCLATPTKWFTETEKENAKILEAASAKVALFTAAQAPKDDLTVDESIQRAKVQKDIGPLADVYASYLSARKALEDIQPHLSDPDAALRELFALELDDLRQHLDTVIAQLPAHLLPTPETDDLPVMLSINAGVGGSEAALFAEEMARLYTRFAELRSWRVSVLSSTEGPGGRGLRETTMKIEPPAYAADGTDDAGVYGQLRWERGVHRVQRVPQTETQGRVHTSTITVVVMPIFPDGPSAPLVDPKDVKSEVMRARGAGGQHVNKTESAVRLTHIPTGISVSMQDSRSQHQNRAWAWEVLRARLSERKHQQEIEDRRARRRSQVRGADRGDKIRTYNFPQDRLSDHRIGLNVTGLREIMDSDGLDAVIDALRRDFNARRLEAILAGDEDFDE
ncbi:hypothetical protein CspeluHIS016_0307370 [Cutaneotrichosporon spelunceum]|uniref:Prokaryotic-type class I peptide chain release factors domain-containing protein n=1 Tax=Cutaneotrichosporon spelunceum TaxID=1672016 RepID=A0AAD3TU21_9TREE|nr:hypothetical protein CspeluHIS016_0307370 [Cutaneotrichosporon spelunceum]